VSTLYLIRHGQASYGGADYDRLSPLGIRQARAIGVTLAGPLHEPLDALYCGPLQRQRDTALHLRAAAAESGRALPEIQELADLTEYPAFELLRHWMPKLVGQQDTKTLDQAFEDIIGRWGRGELETPGVESIHDFVARARRAIDTITGAHGRGARVAAVTSGGIIGVTVATILGLSPEKALETMRVVRNGSITELVWRPGQRSLVGFNHVHHLGEASLVTWR
jgi:broad specificity phosphatase PhoE